jgi:hypothetical protein
VIIVENIVNRRTPTVTGGSGLVKLPLATTVMRANSGTPLKPDGKGAWIVARDGLGEFIAAEHKYGGEQVQAWRICTLDMHTEQYQQLAAKFTPGQRLSVKDVDDVGFPEFIPDPNGVYLAVSQTAVLADMTYASIMARAFVAQAAQTEQGQKGAWK